MILDNVPSHSIEAEQSLIATLIIDNSHFRFCDFLDPEDFYKGGHQKIYRAMRSMHVMKEPVDLVTLAEYLHKDGNLELIGGPAYLVNMVDNSPAFNTESYVKIIKECSLTRQVNMKCLELISSKLTGMELVEKAQTEILSVEASTREDNIKAVKDIVIQHIERLEKANNTREGMGYKTGFPNIDNSLRIKDGKLIIIAGRPKMGKELTLCSDVLLHNGTFKKMGEVMVGDNVASIDGDLSFVTGVFPQGIKPVYKILFSDGRSVKSGLDHQWEVMYRDWDEPRVLTTRELITKLKSKRYKKRLYIPYPSGDFGKDENLLLHPYLMGVLLGDGGFSSHGINLTTSYKHIIEKIQPMLLGCYMKKDSRITYRITNGRGNENKVLDAIKELGLYGKKSINKFIPERYLRASKESRIELIRGLVDTDGTIEKKGSLSYSTSSERLALDFQRLARSLGSHAYMSTKTPFFTYKGEKKKGCLSYRIFVSNKNYQNFVTIPHKKLRTRNLVKHKNLNIESIDFIGDMKCQCISVSHNRELYIANEYITTHNTSLAVTIAKNMDRMGVCIGFLSIEMPESEIMDRWLSMESNIDSSKLGKYKKLSSHEIQTLNDAGAVFYNSNILLDETGSLDISDVERKCRILKKMGAQVIFIDQLSQIGNRQIKAGEATALYSENCTRLARLKKELKVPVFLLHQLNRDMKVRQNKEPIVSDLKQSGKIEEDADAVIFIHRPEEYETDQAAKAILHGKAVLILALNRSGPTYRDDRIRFSHETTSFHQESF